MSEWRWAGRVETDLLGELNSLGLSNHIDGDRWDRSGLGVDLLWILGSHAVVASL